MLKLTNTFTTFIKNKKLTENQNKINGTNITDFLSNNLEGYKALVDNSLVGIYISQNNKIKFCNQQFANIFGYSDVNEIYEKSIFDFTHADYHSKVKEEINLRKTKKKDSSHYLIEGIKKDNSRFFFETFSKIIKFSGKEAIHGTIIDVTKRKLSEDQLKENETQLKEIIKTKEKFFSIIAHDLKNPFNSIIGFSNLLLDEISTMNKNEIVDIVKMINKTSIETMSLLINLLEWSRSQTGALKIHPTLFDINEIVEINLQLLYSQAGNKGIEIFTDIDEPTMVYADKNIFNTIIRNLISNAIKYTHFGGEIEITAKKRKNDIKISVIDNGMGISKELQSKLFIINLEETLAGTNNEKGTGLGLMICKEFVEKSNGKIWVKSELKKGSNFSFSLPFQSN